MPQSLVCLPVHFVFSPKGREPWIRDEWAPRLDGRCTVVRTDGIVLEVFSDPMGAYPVYKSERDGVTWISNSADLLKTDADSFDPSVAASLLGGGWSLSGDPIWTDSTTAAKISGLITGGERVVFTAGTIAGQPGMTNMLKVEEFGS